ncbi:TRPM8 channel-associated factor homolog isoform X2 [Plectropomus leopardus]|uniref:TRPM8 channel-associated factor homolog isoform X2 n=1 Tax=Plectropomus leopardus TaxID=160734 RepID=UPI001C4BDB49|nr:TRPM8 channel-associated factor homolog isoform X2 [Plectropomus leopardus]
MSTKPIQSYHEGAYKSLMKGLKELDFRSSSVPCDLVLTGDQAFPLAVNSEGQVLVAASQYGHGRIVVLAHETYLTTFPALVENALTWLRGDGSDNLSVGVQEYVKAVADNLSKSSFQAKVVGAFSDKLGVGVYVTDAYSAGANMKELVAFLKAGGGVLIGGQAWHWATQNPKANAFLQFPGNKVSGVAGIYFSTAYGGKEVLPVQPQIPSSLKTLRAGKDFKDDLKVLHQGISEFDFGGDISMCEALVHGPLAFPIGTTEDGRAFLAGSYYGKGRVVVIAHEYLLKVETLASLWTNAIDWLDQGRNGVVGVAPDVKLANKSGLKFEKTKLKKDLSVFVCNIWSDDHAEIQDFVAEGGGLLIGGQLWYWASTHWGNPMTEHSGNKILKKMGLGLMPPKIYGGGSNKPLVPNQAVKNANHFRHRLQRFAGSVTQGDKLTKDEEENLKQLGIECAYFLKMEAHESYQYTHVLSVLTDIMKISGMPQVSEKNPVKTPKDHLLLSVGPEAYKVSPDRDALLPYLIKDLPSLPLVNNQRIRVTVNTAGGEEWISTGLYLSPGMKTQITIPAMIVNKSWEIQISCQSDTLNHDELKRAPRVVERFPVTRERMQLQNMWGGLIYLVAPPNTKVEGAEVIVQQAISAPYYKSGVTTTAEWSSLRKAPAPWAEMEFDNIILTAPSDSVRDLERPEEVERLWNEIMKGVADLAAIPQKLPRKERIVADVQISYGLLHAGYPIMMYSKYASELFSVKDAKTVGIWGQLHELGHNQQRPAWEFGGHTGEATCNLWSVYLSEEVLGVDRAKAHSTVAPAARKNTIDKYVKEGRQLSKWEVWTALETYLQAPPATGLYRYRR